MGMDFRLEPLGRWGAEQILLLGCLGGWLFRWWVDGWMGGWVDAVIPLKLYAFEHAVHLEMF